MMEITELKTRLLLVEKGIQHNIQESSQAWGSKLSLTSNPARNIGTVTHHEHSQANGIQRAPGCINTCIEDGHVRGRGQKAETLTVQNKMSLALQQTHIWHMNMQGGQHKRDERRQQAPPTSTIRSTTHPIAILQEATNPGILRKAAMASTRMTPALGVLKVNVLANSLQPHPLVGRKEGRAVLEGSRVHTQNMASPSPTQLKNTHEQRRQAPLMQAISLRRMLTEATDAIERGGLRWKPIPASVLPILGPASCRMPPRKASLLLPRVVGILSSTCVSR